MTGVARPPAPPAPPGTATSGTSPYRGLLPYAERDADYFFGRRDDVKIITANLMAARLTLHYAPSGVGKTSVLQAGVAHELRALTDEFLPVVVREWSGDARIAVDTAIGRAAAELLQQEPPEAVGDAALVDLVRRWAAELDQTLLLIFDQFEEFLHYHGDDWEPDGDAQQMAAMLGARDLKANVLIGLREDALASLDRFKGAVPHLFDNYLRLLHLDMSAGREAIECPIERWSRDHADDRVTIEPALVDALLEQVVTGRIALGRAGAGAAGGAGEGVETPFLQLVLERLWEEERASGSATLRSATLARLGGAVDLVRDHLDVRMQRLTPRHRDVAAAVFHQLVTPSGRKVTRSVRDLAGWTAIPAEEIEPVLRTLARSDWSILRPVGDGQGDDAAFEALHDVLAEAMLDWRARHEEARRRRQLTRRVVFGAVMAVAVLVAAILLVATFARQADRANGNAALAESRSQLGVRSHEAVQNALTAVDKLGAKALPALRAAVAQSDLQGVVRMPAGIVQTLRVSPDGRRLAAAGEDGDVRVWTLGKDAAPLRLHGGTHVRTLAFSPDSARLATAGEGPDLEVWRVGDGERVERFGLGEAGVEAVRWSPRGERLLVYDREARLIDLATGASEALGVADFADWSPGGKRIVTAVGETVRVRTATGRELARLELGDEVSAVGFTAGGSHALIATRDGRVLRGAELCRTPGAPLESATFTRDGRFLLASDARSLRVVRVAGCGENRLPRPPLLRQSSVSSDGRLVVVVAGDGAARVWDRRSGQQLATLVGNWPTRARLALRPAADGAEVVFTAGNDGLLRQWVAAAEPLARIAETAGDDVLGAAFDASGGAVVLATEAGVRRADWLAGGDGEPVGPSRELEAAVVSADGSTVAAVSDGAVVVMRVDEGRWVPIGREAEAGPPTSLALSADGSRLAVTGAGAPVEVWDTRGGGLIDSTAPTRGSGRPYAGFTADGRGVVVVDRSVRLFAPPGAPGRRLSPLDAPEERGEAAPLGAAGRRVAVVVKGAQPLVFDLEDRGPPAELAGRRLRVDSIALSPDGQVVATAGFDGVWLWDSGSGELLAGLASGDFDTVAFAPDGRHVLASGARAGAQVFACRACGDEADLREAAAALLDGALLPTAPLPEPPVDEPFSGPESLVPTPTPTPSPEPSSSDPSASGAPPPVARLPPQPTAQPAPLLPARPRPPASEAPDDLVAGGD